MKRFAFIASFLLFGAGMASLGWCFGVRSDAISHDEAVGIATARVGSGNVRFTRLLRLKGKPVWDAEIAHANKPGVTEVRVHAMTGEVIEVRHESVRKADEELSELAKHLGITAAHVIPKAKQNQQAIPENLLPLSAEDTKPQ